MSLCPYCKCNSNKKSHSLTHFPILEIECAHSLEYHLEPVLSSTCKTKLSRKTQIMMIRSCSSPMSSSRDSSFSSRCCCIVNHLLPECKLSTYLSATERLCYGRQIASLRAALFRLISSLLEYDSYLEVLRLFLVC